MINQLFVRPNFKKIAFYIGIWFFMAIVIAYIDYAGRDFPKTNQELHFTEGKLFAVKEFVKNGRSGGVETQISLFSFYPLNETKFGCAYSVANDLSHCPDMTTYNGKMAKIGWYQHKPILGFNNPQNQLVTIEIDGKQILSLEESKKIIGLNNKAVLFRAIFYPISFILFLYTSKIIIGFFYIPFQNKKTAKNL